MAIPWLPQSVLLALLLTACAAPQPPAIMTQAAKPSTVDAKADIPQQPEGPSGWTHKPAWGAQRFAVAAANPLAADAGYEMLRAGGSAVDAAIAVQLVLTLVEPQSSGIAGGAFLMHWDGQQAAALDGRVTAPAAADEGLFLKPDGKPMSYTQAVVGGRSVGTPGLMRMLELAHTKYGVLPWARLFEPAIRLSENGFELGARMHQMLVSDPQIKTDSQALKYFFDANGAPLPVGTLLRNPALAEVLRVVAKSGAEAFMRGPIAADIVRRVRGHASNPGLLSEADMAGYSPKLRAPICTEWREYWRVCGFPPPSSGHRVLAAKH